MTYPIRKLDSFEGSLEQEKKDQLIQTPKTPCGLKQIKIEISKLLIDISQTLEDCCYKTSIENR